MKLEDCKAHMTVESIHGTRWKPTYTITRVNRKKGTVVLVTNDDDKQDYECGPACLREVKGEST